MTTFCEIKPDDDLAPLAALAREIWTEYYTPLLGAAQIEYMLKNFQSEAPMRRQLTEQHYRYFYLMQDGEAAGYLGIQLEDHALFLSKLYVRRACRGRGTARDVMAFVEGWARGANLDRVWLTVNRGNEGSIRSYERMGFTNVGTQDADIGGGYIMDDYLFEKRI